MSVLTERFERLEPRSLAVKERIIPGVLGVITTELTYAIPHQYRRYGCADNDSTTRDSLTAGEGRPSITASIDTLRYGTVTMWLVRTRFINPENRLDAADPTTQILEYEQIWQESTVTTPNYVYSRGKGSITFAAGEMSKVVSFPTITVTDSVKYFKETDGPDVNYTTISDGVGFTVYLTGPRYDAAMTFLYDVEYS